MTKSTLPRMSTSSSSSSSSENEEKLSSSFVSNKDLIASLKTKLDLEVEAKIKKIYEKRNEDGWALDSFLCLYPDIPIIRDKGVDVRIRKCNLNHSCRTLILGATRNSFFVCPTEGPVANVAREMVFDRRAMMVRTVRTIPREHNLRFFDGKTVVVGPPGCEYHEDEETITLPPQEEDEENYFNFHRNKDGMVVSNINCYDPDLYNEDQLIFQFAGVPWLLKKLNITDNSNVIFRNLHTGEVRRYIVRDADIDSFFMLGGDFYYFLREGMETHIVQCRSGKVFGTVPDFVPLPVESCEDYVIASNLRDKGSLILYLRP
jgi:hypothetical protein